MITNPNDDTLPVMPDSLRNMTTSSQFSKAQLADVVRAAALAEELVSNHYKLSASQWLKKRYDIKTALDLKPEEVVEGPFAQVIRYEGRPNNGALTSTAFDFYKICLQDPAILSTLSMCPRLDLFPFALYILTHELIHIVRFSRFLQNFQATQPERLAEEARVHRITRDILEPTRLPGLSEVLKYYSGWQKPFEHLKQT